MRPSNRLAIDLILLLTTLTVGAAEAAKLPKPVLVEKFGYAA